MKANHRSSAAGLMQKVLAERSFKPNTSTRQVLSDTIFPNTHRSFHLESSTATLQFASTTHDSLDVIPSASRQLIATLKKTDWLDRIFVISGLAVLFILKQPIINRGFHIAFF
ncbi:hypothetical protein CY34DRAFT_813219 [Suillus luteus UH-Slu-Lm8-n1]|uniref:Uncharacterized protein n=1 Tax=Suillus luteus UH-Slu-Lm8-n1 TaxID=930992 RepID=A0A0C9Z963_9AGAM|nr:hypothetical protein CY34DRAFT_813219 [Suillus luteus UH-Slu-Lm8-n1]